MNLSIRTPADLSCMYRITVDCLFIYLERAILVNDKSWDNVIVDRDHYKRWDARDYNC